MNPNNYKQQKLRGLKRKLEAIESLGGSCSKCGYNKNISALDFHHLNPKEKDFSLDIRKFSNFSNGKLLKELDKCVLLCANCHREEHNPSLDRKNIDLLKKSLTKISLNHLTGTECPNCKKRFKKMSGKKYCSKYCRNFFKKLPSNEDIVLKYRELKSWEKVAQYFNTTRRTIQTIRKNLKSSYEITKIL